MMNIVIQTGFLKKFSGKLSVILFIFLFALRFTAHSSAPTISISEDKNEVAVGSGFTVTVSLKWARTEGAGNIRVSRITAPSSPYAKLVDSKQKTESLLSGSQISMKQQIDYYYIAEGTGAVSLSPCVIEYYRLPARESTEILRSGTVTINMSPAWKMRLKSLAGMILAILILAGSGALFGKLFKKKRKKTYISEKKADDRLPEVSMLADINEAGRLLLEGDYSGYFENIKDMLAKYINDNYQAAAGNEIKDIPYELKDIYVRFKLISEKIKFSGYCPAKHEQEKLTKDILKYFKGLLEDHNPMRDIDTV